MQPFWFGLATDLLDCACTALAATERGCPDWACVVPGANIIEDFCCEGQLQVLLERTYRTVDFPNQANDFLPCGGGYTGFDFLVSLRRCAPGPSCEQASLNAQLLYVEGQAMWDALICCLSNASDVFPSVLRDLRPSPGSPNGNCVGWDIRLTIGANDSCTGCADAGTISP